MKKRQRLAEMLLPFGCTALIVSTLLSIAACAKGHTSAASSAETPSPAPMWPNYSALDYDKPGHPPLTSQQVRMIRKTLALLKPCQAIQLRYAFPDWRVFSSQSNSVMIMALFFDDPRDQGYPEHVSRALWKINDYYNVAEGHEFPLPYDNEPFPKDAGTANEVRSEGCASALDSVG